MSEVKFTEEELNKINDFQLRYARIKDDFGGVCLNKINLRNQIEELDNLEVELSSNFKKVQEDEKNFFNDLNKKYGEGSFDPKTGVFTPIEENKSEKTE
tara:strand:- start:4347 stop:4643 length:297 start_codon:yes stop_codon:yes gene_type:complete